VAVNKNLIKFLTNTHLFWYQLSGGIFGTRMSGMPVLLLTTTGRKSGRKRTVPLTHQRDGDGYVVIASNGGNVQHPAWYLNLRSNPDAEVTIGREKTKVRAEVANDADRQRLFASAVEKYGGYADYERETKREIPVVILKPVP
jgi:deazaflavin-dependent oxidoreductase (nitroreductase family)